MLFGSFDQPLYFLPLIHCSMSDSVPILFFNSFSTFSVSSSDVFHCLRNYSHGSFPHRDFTGCQATLK
jgi:hypothetical protein